MKENGFSLEKARSWRYPAETITDADYSDFCKYTYSIWILVTSSG